MVVVYVLSLDPISAYAMCFVLNHVYVGSILQHVDQKYLCNKKQWSNQSSFLKGCKQGLAIEFTTWSRRHGTPTWFLYSILGEIHYNVWHTSQVKCSKELIACSVQLASTHGINEGNSLCNGSGGGTRAPFHGYIAALKDGFGFIETADHSKEVFFHFR